MALTGLLVVAFAVPVQAASGAPAWNPAAQEVAPPAGADPEFPFAKLEAVSCGAPGYCSAAGDYSEPGLVRQVMVVDQVAGVWHQAQKVSLPSGHEYPVLNQISCSSAGNCTATGVVDIGSESQGLIVSSHNGTWGTAQILPGPTGATWTWINDVSCPADGECVAVGGFEENPSHLPSAPSHPFAAVESGGIWGPAVQIAVTGSPETSQLSEVDCPSTGTCSALGSIDNTKPIVASLSGGAWNTATELAAPGPGLLFAPNDLSCGAAGSCVIAGAYSESGKQRPAVAAQTAGTWGAPTPLALPADVAAVNSHSDLDAVSCTDTGTCTALGSYLNSAEEEKAFTANEVSGTWQQAVQVAVGVPVEPSFPYAMGWSGIDCVSAQSCGATGFAFFHGTTALMEGSSWGTGASPIVLPANAQSQEAGGISSMACGGAGACAAAGGFVDTEGMERAMVLSTEGYAGSGGGEGGDDGKGGTGADAGGSSTTGAGSGSGGPSSTGAGPGLTPPGSGGTARLSANAAPVKGNTALIPLKCPTGKACSGVLKLLAAPSASASSSAISARARQAKILVGKKAFSVPAGKKATIKVPLTKRGKALIKAGGKHSLKVTLAGSGVTRRSLVLKSSSREGATSSAASLKASCVAVGTATPKVLAGGTWLSHPGDRKTRPSRQKPSTSRCPRIARGPSDARQRSNSRFRARARTPIGATPPDTSRPKRARTSKRKSSNNSKQNVRNRERAAGCRSPVAKRTSAESTRASPAGVASAKCTFIHSGSSTNRATRDTIHGSIAARRAAASRMSARSSRARSRGSRLERSSVAGSPSSRFESGTTQARGRCRKRGAVLCEDLADAR